jgi:hypothetical protein
LRKVRFQGQTGRQVLMQSSSALTRSGHRSRTAKLKLADCSEPHQRPDRGSPMWPCVNQSFPYHQGPIALPTALLRDKVLHVRLRGPFGGGMRRREFIAGLGVTAAWPIVTQAQQSDQMRRIAYLTTNAEKRPADATMGSSFPQGSRRARLDRGTQCSDRLSFRRRRRQLYAQARKGVARTPA